MPVRVGSDVWAALPKLGEEEYSIVVVLHSALPLAQAMTAAEAAWNVIWDDEQSPQPDGSQVTVTVEGPAVWFEERPTAKLVLDRFAAELTTAGVAHGELNVFEVHYPEAIRNWSPSTIEAHLAVRSRIVKRLQVNLCSVADDLRIDLVSRAMNWCYDWGRGEVQGHVGVRMVSSAVSRDNANALLDAATLISARSIGEPAQFVVESESGLFRTAIFDLAFGYVALAAGSSRTETYDLESSLAAVRQAMIIFAPVTVRRFAKYTFTRGPAGLGAHTLERWDPPVQARERYEESELPDAFGLVVVPNPDADLVYPLDPEWHATDLGTRTLLEHNDHQAWYGSFDPDPATLRRAREQLRNIIRPGVI